LVGCIRVLFILMLNNETFIGTV